MKKLNRRSHTLNPFDGLDKDDPHAIDACNDMASAIVPLTGEEKEPHWPKGAISFIAAVAAMVIAFGSKSNKTRSIQTVRELLGDPAKLDAAIQVMKASDWGNGLLAQMGSSLLYFKDKELNSVMTTVGDYLRSFATPAVVAATETSSFDLTKIRTNKMSLFFVVPPERKHAQENLLRFYLYAAVRECVRAGPNGRIVYFVLDEAAAIGHMDIIDDALALGRSFGIRIIFVFQSAGQVKKCFPEGQEYTFHSNTSQVYFGVNDAETAENVSKRLGEKTTIVDSGGTNTGTSHGRTFGRDRSTKQDSSSGRSKNWNQQVRRLMTPDEILALPRTTALTFAPGMRPINTNLLRYYEENLNPGLLARITGDLAGVLKAAALCAISVSIAVGLTMAVHGAKARQPAPQYQSHPNIFTR